MKARTTLIGCAVAVCTVVAATAASSTEQQKAKARVVVNVQADCNVTDVRLNGKSVCPTTTAPPTTRPSTTAAPTTGATTFPSTTTSQPDPGTTQPATTAPATTVPPTTAPATTAPPTTAAPTTAPPTTTPPTGFPNSGNTGVPLGTTLTSYTGPCTITAANTVIDRKTINCALVIRAAGVKVTNSLINGTISTDEESSGYSFSIIDSDVRAPQAQVTAVGAVNFTMLRVEVTGGNRSVNCWKQCDVQDSYVHAQFRDDTGRAHESGIRMGSDNLIRHNTIVCDAPDIPPDAGCSADLTGYGDFGPVERVLVDRNLFKASTGGVCAYGGASGDDGSKPYGNQSNNIRFTNNVFERGPTGKCGSYFPITDFDSSRPGNVWSNNTWDTGGNVPPAN